jgi:cytosine/adenosine deaminase-related metal-dependent hydrolase
VATAGARIAAVGGVIAEGKDEVDLGGRILLPGLVNAHDHLDLSTFPPLGRPPYPSAYAWAADVEGTSDQAAAMAALAVPLPDRLFLGGLRNLLSGATAVAHHGPNHRALARRDFPVRVLAKYEFAHSPGFTPALRRSYRTTDRRIPWLIHAGEGTDARSRGEVQALVDANVLRQNTVLIHAIALGAGDPERIAAAKACVVWCPQSNRRLYGATADVPGLRAAGVRIGLGSDSPMSGARDALSNLAVARSERMVTDGELVDMATSGSAEVARLPGGRTEPGQPADLVAVDSLEPGWTAIAVRSPWWSRRDGPSTASPRSSTRWAFAGDPSPSTAPRAGWTRSWPGAPPGWCARMPPLPAWNGCAGCFSARLHSRRNVHGETLLALCLAVGQRQLVLAGSHEPFPFAAVFGEHVLARHEIPGDAVEAGAEGAREVRTAAPGPH